MTKLELAGRVRDVCAGILFRKGEVEAAHALFWQPAPLLLRASRGVRPAFRRRSVQERHAAELLAALRERANVRIPIAGPQVAFPQAVRRELRPR